MTPQERLALLLEYQKKQPELGSTLPAMNRAPTGAEPQQSWLDKLSDAASGAGYGLASQVESIGQMALHPLDTLHSMAAGAGKAMDNPAAAGTAVVQGLKDAAGQAMFSPFNMGRAVGANVSVNPRKLAAMLEIPMIRELNVYHGTPHQFPATEANPLGEFDSSKIGTGEGAQVYGRGIYLAESPDVAKSYRSNLVKDPSFLEKKTGKIISKESPEYADLIDRQTRMERNGYGAEFDKKYQVQEGAFYTVDLPDEKIAQMLDWDKPLGQQPKAIRDAINRTKALLPDNAMADLGDDLSLLYGKDVTPSVFLNTWEALTGSIGSGEAALQKHGIPGIKYLDAGSRDAKKGTRNFVVFPGEEKHLKILERK